MQSRIIVAFGIFFLLVATSLTAQERNRGGRTSSGQGGHDVRAPEGTRERPASVPRVTEYHHDPQAGSDPHPVLQVPIPAASTVIDGGASCIDPPRPAPSGFTVIFSGGTEGYGVVLGDCRVMPEYAGFDFSGARCVPYDDPEADMFFEDAGSASHMVVGEDSEIQDLGSTASLGQISGLRMVEWSRSRDVILEERRSYAVRTWEGSCAMFRVVSLVPGRVVFDWVVGRPPQVLSGTHERVQRAPWVTRVGLSR